MNLECVNKCKYHDTIYCTEDCGSYIKVGSRLRDVNFNNIRSNHLCIFVGDKIVAEEITIRKTLNKAVPYVDYRVKSCNYFFDEFVIRLEEEK